MHTLGISKRWARYRLVPTALCSIATLSHFNYVLLTKPAAYPLLNILPCMLETILVLITLFTISLNAVSQLLLEGEVTRPLFGHTRTLVPKWDEEFSIVLLRLGTASLEATSVEGLGKELGLVNVGDAGVLSKGNGSNDGVVELTVGGVLSVTPSPLDKGKGGFAHEVKTVKVKTDSGNLLIDRNWLQGLSQYGMALLGIARGFFRLATWVLWYRWRGVQLRQSHSEPAVQVTEVSSRILRRSPRRRSGSVEDEHSMYRRFLSGENVSDDEDMDYVPGDATLADAAETSDNESEYGPEADESDAGGKETARLYSDILDPSWAQPSAAPGPVLFAHMTSTSDAPLTRRRYKQLVSGQQQQPADRSKEDDDLVDWLTLAHERRQQTTSSPGEGILEGRMSCVICTVEPREIICWPCRYEATSSYPDIDRLLTFQKVPRAL